MRPKNIQFLGNAHAAGPRTTFCQHLKKNGFILYKHTICTILKLLSSFHTVSGTSFHFNYVTLHHSKDCKVRDLGLT